MGSKADKGTLKFGLGLMAGGVAMAMAMAMAVVMVMVMDIAMAMDMNVVTMAMARVKARLRTSRGNNSPPKPSSMASWKSSLESTVAGVTKAQWRGLRLGLYWGSGSELIIKQGGYTFYVLDPNQPLCSSIIHAPMLPEGG